MARKLSRLQKASALVPMAVLVGAWGAALTNAGLASAVGGSDDDTIPNVPPSPSTSPPPSRSRRAASIRAPAPTAPSTFHQRHPVSCAVLLPSRRDPARQGRPELQAPVEPRRRHRPRRVQPRPHQGNSLSAEGLAQPGIYGAPLDGNGVAKISDTDNGPLDKDTVWDRAVGPMQFIPGTWTKSASTPTTTARRTPRTSMTPPRPPASTSAPAPTTSPPTAAPGPRSIATTTPTPTSTWS